MIVRHIRPPASKIKGGIASRAAQPLFTVTVRSGFRLMVWNTTQ